MTLNEKERFEEYNRKEIPLRWKRMKWIRELEREYKAEKPKALRLPPLSAIQLYHDAMNSFVFGNYLACIITIGSAIEALLGVEIPSERFNRRASLSNLIEIALAEELISESLFDDLHDFSVHIRNHVVHPKGTGGLHMLGFKAKQKSQRSVTWSATPKQPIPSSLGTNAQLGKLPEEAAKLGIKMYLQAVREIPTIKIPNSALLED